jgi:hypothetical protein
MCSGLTVCFLFNFCSHICEQTELSSLCTVFQTTVAQYSLLLMRSHDADALVGLRSWARRIVARAHQELRRARGSAGADIATDIAFTWMSPFVLHCTGKYEKALEESALLLPGLVPACSSPSLLGASSPKQSLNHDSFAATAAGISTGNQVNPSEVTADPSMLVRTMVPWGQPAVHALVDAVTNCFTVLGEWRSLEMWLQRLVQLKQAVAALVARERDLERRKPGTNGGSAVSSGASAIAWMVVALTVGE